MEMKLSVADRIYLQNLDTLPRSGNLVTARVLREFFENIQFKVEEIENWEIHEEGTQIKWNAEKARNIEITVSETLCGIVVAAAEKSENINTAALPTFDKFFDLKKVFEASKEEKKDGGKDSK